MNELSLSDENFSDFGSPVPPNIIHTDRNLMDEKLTANVSNYVDVSDLKQFSNIPYLSNYNSILSLLLSNQKKSNFSKYNETLLKKYYLSRRNINYQTSIRNDNPIKSISNNSSVEHNINEEHSDDGSYIANSSDTGSDNNSKVQVPSLTHIDFDMNIILEKLEKPLDEEKLSSLIQSKEVIDLHTAASYIKYCQKLFTVNVRKEDILKQHNLWVPSVHDDFKKYLLSERRKENSFSYIQDTKSNPLFVDGESYMAGKYDIFSGSSLVPSLFSEYKPPSFLYHTAVELAGKCYILGGLIPIYGYEEDAPDLSQFKVDGIKNIPPPLLSQIINNPSMINNPHLYIYSLPSSRLIRPIISGQIPPPLIGMRGSKLTDRYLFFYGGFEIKTDSVCDENGVIYLKKRAFVNNMGYILDVVSFKFTKVEIIAPTISSAGYPELHPRFGHTQISVNMNATVSNTPFSSNVSQTSLYAEPQLKLDSKDNEEKSDKKNNFGLHTIYIFGGYRQTGDDRYEAIADMWKIEVTVVARGKGGFCKFGDAALAKSIKTIQNSENWPSGRAFCGYCVPNMRLVYKQSFETYLLDRLDSEYMVDFESINVRNKSRPIFPNVATNMESDVINSRKPMDASNKVNTSGSGLFPPEQVPGGGLPGRGKPNRTIALPTNAGARTIVIHGGSAGTDIYSDMWWFDLELEVWRKIDTYAKTENKMEGLVPLNLGIVGHSMNLIGHMLVCTGGMIESDVNKYYKNIPYQFNLDRVPAGSTIFNTFDLNTQSLAVRSIKSRKTEDDNTAYLTMEDTPEAMLVVSVGGEAIEYDGNIILIGGVVIPRKNMDLLYLRGAMLECIMPSMSLLA